MNLLTDVGRILEFLKKGSGFYYFITLLLLASVFVSSISFSFPYLMSNVTNKYVSGDAGGATIIVAIYFALAFIQGLFTYLTNYAIAVYSTKRKPRLLLGFYRKIFNLRYVEYLGMKEHASIFKRTADALSLTETVLRSVVFLFTDIISLLILFIILLYIDTVLFYISLVTVFMPMVILYLVSRNINSSYDESIMAQESLTNSLFEGINNYKTIKSISAENFIVARSSKLVEKLVIKTVVLKRLILRSSLLNEFTFNILSLMFVISVLAKYAVNDVGYAFGIIVLYFSLSQPSKQFVNRLHDIRSSSILLSKYNDLFAKQDEVSRLGKPDSKELFTRPPSIEFLKVNFFHRGTNFSLKDASFSVAGGKSLGLVGKSGAGKSTVLDILLGFLQPTSGQVIIGNFDSSKYNYDSILKNTSVILQGAKLFEVSLRENLIAGNSSSVSDQEIFDAIDACYLTNLLDRLPDGLCTIITNETLSGGEIQRVLIARAILRDSKLIIFDEPTAALDQETENTIMKLIKTQLTDATVIIVAHKLKTISECDELVLVEDGKIIAQGPLNYMYENVTEFKKLFDDSVVG